MRELSVFIDESGDFGEYDYHSPFYIITMVFHDQDEDIKPAVEKLNRELSYLVLILTGFASILDRSSGRKKFIQICR